MQAKYIRVSTVEQNTDRQTDFNGLTFIDKCSGTIPFSERPEAKKLLSNKDITEVHVHSIDRLGRNTVDILNTIQELTDLGINVISEKEGISTLINGKVNPTAKMMISLLATLSEFELSRIRERQLEGIAEAKKRGAYKINGGNKPKETPKLFLTKSRNAKCFKLLKSGASIRTSAKLSEVSNGTAQKIKKMILEGVV